MTMDADQKLYYARMTIWTKKEFGLFKFICYHYDLRIVEPEDAYADTAYVYFSDRDKQFKVECCRTFVDALEIDQLVFVLLHEFMHPLHDHLKRCGSRDRFIYNLAGDHIINSALYHDVSNGNLPMKAPTGKRAPFVVAKKQYKWANDNLTTEEVYAKLKDEIDKKKIKITIKKNKGDGKQQKCPDCEGSGKKQKGDGSEGEGQGQGQGEGEDAGQGDCPSCGGSGQQQQGSGSGGGGTTIEIEYPDGTKEEMEVDFDTTGDNREGEESDKSGNEVNVQLERALNEIKSELQVAKELMKSDSRGFNSSRVFEMLNELIQVDVPLETILLRSISSKMKPSTSSRSWKVINRTLYGATGMLLPGPGEEEQLDTCIYVIDSSGSVSTEELKMAAGGVVGCKELFTKYVVLKHDYNLLDTKIFEQDIDESDLLKIHGRGGTSHSEVFEYIEQYFQEEGGISMVVMITDYESDIEHLYDSEKFEWVHEVPITIMLTPGQNPNMVSDVIDPSPIVLKKAR